MARRYLRPRKPAPDFFRIFADLERYGLWPEEVSRITGIPCATLRYWARGTEGRWVDTEAVLVLWLERTGKTRNDVPHRQAIEAA